MIELIPQSHRNKHYIALCQAAGQRAIDWYLDTGDCFFCLAHEDGRHETHCELGKIFGTYEDE